MYSTAATEVNRVFNSLWIDIQLNYVQDVMLCPSDKFVEVQPAANCVLSLSVTGIHKKVESRMVRDPPKKIFMHHIAGLMHSIANRVWLLCFIVSDLPDTCLEGNKVRFQLSANPKSCNLLIHTYPVNLNSTSSFLFSESWFWWSILWKGIFYQGPCIIMWICCLNHLFETFMWKLALAPQKTTRKPTAANYFKTSFSNENHASLTRHTISIK